MPLRDHFHPPVSDRHNWTSLHGGWPMMIVQQLYDILPEGYTAAPTVQLGTAYEIDVAAYETEDARRASDHHRRGNGGVAVATSPEPTLTLEADLSPQDEFEVRVYDTRYERQLVAAIEIVSPSNEDRPESRRAFVAEVAALLRSDVSVSIVDPVTIRQFNLYAELLELVGADDSQWGDPPPHVYAATIRKRTGPRSQTLLDAWHYPMAVGQPLPTLPIWLKPDLRVMLPLEASYENTCRLLRIE